MFLLDTLMGEIKPVVKEKMSLIIGINLYWNLLLEILDDQNLEARLRKLVFNSMFFLLAKVFHGDLCVEKTCSDGKLWVWKQRWIFILALFGTFDLSKIWCKCQNFWFLCQKFFLKSIFLIKTFIEEIKLVVTENTDNENRDKSVLFELFGVFRQSGFWCKKIVWQLLHGMAYHKLEFSGWNLGGRTEVSTHEDVKSLIIDFLQKNKGAFFALPVHEDSYARNKFFFAIENSCTSSRFPIDT